ncbi:hypothetical protein [Rosistilla oblonga]|uniref:hypothetical protein n=1 Tax=Rosistilla oblonga TaxID=2527990 RepID=UPI003A985A0D
MAKYRIKPTFVDAWEWDETKATLEVMRAAGLNRSCFMSRLGANHVHTLCLPTPCGPVLANKGDYILKRENGKFDVCKRGVFLDLYEVLPKHHYVPVGHDEDKCGICGEPFNAKIHSLPIQV